jgi:hypothetical protein
MAYAFSFFGTRVSFTDGRTFHGILCVYHATENNVTPFFLNLIIMKFLL